MTQSYTYAFTYLTCQKCTERVRCDACAKALTAAFVKNQAVDAFDINMEAHRLTLSTDQDEDDILDALEELGIFAD